jgi:hypothetical protein
MVEMLGKKPALTDYNLAKACLGRVSSARRKLAREARLLALYRGRLPVKFHKSRGAKRHLR